MANSEKVKKSPVKPVKTEKKQKDLSELIDKHSRHVKVFSVGEMIEGTVVSTGKKYILVDVGAKSEGLIPADELKLINRESVELGEKIKALVVYPENNQGNLVLSLKKAQSEHNWGGLQQSYDEGEIITVTVLDYFKGGLIVDAAGQRGFVPISHLSREHFEQFNNAMANKDSSEDLGGLRGSRLEVKIIEIKPDKNRLVLSEQEALPQEEMEAREQRLAEIQKGDVIKGKVSTVLPYGILVDLDGVDGLVHISEIAWEKVDATSDYFKTGDDIEVKVIGKDGDKIALSVKELQDNPWDNVEEKYPLGTRLTAKVSKVVPFGAFVELEPGLDGLIHISETVGPLKVGEEIEAVVVNVDSSDRKLALSIRQIQDQKIYR